MDTNLFQNIELITVHTTDWSDDCIYHYTDKIDTGYVKQINSIERLCALTNDRVRHYKTEVLLDGRWIIPYFDYDFALPVGTKVNKRLINKHFTICQQGITCFFSAIDPEFNFNEHVRYDNRHGIKIKEDKEVPHISFHFFVHNSTRTKLEYLREIMKDFHCLNSIFDTSVYNNNRKFCMSWGYKSELDQRRKVPMNGSHREHIIQHVPKEYNKVLKYLSQLSVETVMNGKPAIRNLNELGNIKPYAIPENMNYNFDKNDVEEVVKRIPNNKNFEEWDVYWSLMYSLKECVSMGHTRLTDDDVRKIFHRFSSAHPRYNAASVDKMWYGAGSLKYGLGIVYLHKLLERNYPGFWNNYDKLSEFTKDLKYLTSASNKTSWEDDYDAPEMIQYPTDKYNIVCIKGNTGVGKTIQLLKTIQGYDRDASVCIVSYGVVLCKKYAAMMADLGFELYSDLPKGPISAKRVVICLDSLVRLKNNTHFDYVVIDEALSVFEHFDSDKMQNPSFVSMVLQRILQRSSQLLFIDANIDSLMCYDVVKRIEQQRGVKAHWVRNRFKRKTNRKATFMSGEYDETDFIAHVCSELKRNFRIVCPVSSKAVGEKLFNTVSDMFPNKKVKLYSADTSRAELHRDSMNTNEAWGDLDLLIYTPTISAGVSFELRWFHKQIAFFNSDMFHAPANTCFQQLFRVRQLIQGNMIIYTNVKKFKNLVVDADKIENFLQYSYNTVSTLYQNTELFTQIDAKGDYCFNTDTLSFDIIKNIVLAKNRSIMFFVEILQQALSSYDIPISVQAVRKREALKANVEQCIETHEYEMDTTFVEQFNKPGFDKGSLVLSDEQMRDLEETLTKGTEDVDKTTIIKRNITHNLSNWSASIHKITPEFFENCIYTTNNKEQRAALSYYHQACRFKRISDPVEADIDRLHTMIVKATDNDNNLNVFRNLQKTGMQQIIATKKLLRGVFDMDDLEKIKDPTISYKNQDWKPRLVEYLKSLTKSEFKMTLNLFGLHIDKTYTKTVAEGTNADGSEWEKKKNGKISYNNPDTYNSGRSRRSVTFVQTLVKKTFGIDFEIANTRNDKMRFVADHWNDIIQHNHTFLSHSVDIVPNNEASKGEGNRWKSYQKVLRKLHDDRENTRVERWTTYQQKIRERHESLKMNCMECGCRGATINLDNYLILCSAKCFQSRLRKNIEKNSSE